MIDTILFATDLGIFTPYALEHVYHLAGRYRAKVVVVHAVEPMNGWANALMKSYLPERSKKLLGEIAIEELLPSLEQQIKSFLDLEMREAFNDPGIEQDIRVVPGSPAVVILEEAKRQQVDLIVMGSHGPSTTQQHMLGSVTQKVLQQSKVPIFMVPMINAHSLCQSERAVQV